MGITYSRSCSYDNSTAAVTAEIPAQVGRVGLDQSRHCSSDSPRNGTYEDRYRSCCRQFYRIGYRSDGAGTAYRDSRFWYVQNGCPRATYRAQPENRFGSQDIEPSRANVQTVQRASGSSRAELNIRRKERCRVGGRESGIRSLLTNAKNDSERIDTRKGSTSSPSDSGY